MISSRSCSYVTMRCNRNRTSSVLLVTRYGYTTRSVSSVRLKSSDGVVNEFSPHKVLKWYACGPTVYDHSHLGHARAYIHSDIIRRVMSKFFNIEIQFALGVTDIDDKIINKMYPKKSIEAMKTMTSSYEDSFFEDLNSLRVQKPSLVLRVSEHIEHILQYIGKLIDLNKAYTIDGDVYFAVDPAASDRYARFGPLPDENESDSKAAKNAKKRYFRDFALWKAAKDHEPSWESPWGRGRPGWHIECSAMTHAVFGDSVDIHSGGVDLKFPHHTNEIAQSEAHSCSADPWCGHWVHTGHLFIDGLKMSKSLKNFVSIKDYLASDSYSAQPVRDLWVFLLQHKYSSDLHFSADRLKQAAVVRRRIDDFIALVTAQESRAVPRLKYNNDAITLLSRLSESKAKALEALSDDINTPLALAVIGDLIGSATAYCYDMSVTRSPIEPLLETRLFVQDFLSKLGLETSLGTTHSDTVEAVTEASPSVRTEDVIQQLVDFRTEVKDHCKHHHKKNLEEAHDSLQRLLTACDKLRDVVAPSIGVSITDVKGGGSVWHQVNSGREHSVPVQQPRA